MILVLGKNGQLANSFARNLKEESVLWGHGELPTLEEVSLVNKLNNLRPHLIINTAAFTAVDKAEAEQANAVNLNVHLPTILGRYAVKNKIPIIHFSTDYVFDGSGNLPRTETDATQPLNIYGETKLAGERALIETGALAYIFRTSWVFSHHGNNFLKTILKLAAEKEELRVVADQIGSPTYSEDLARVIIRKLKTITDLRVQPGVYNISGTGYTSWSDFAQKIVDQARLLGWPLRLQRIVPIPSSEYPTPAKRPLNSRLSQEKFHQNFKIEMPPWQDAVNRCLEELKAQR